MKILGLSTNYKYHQDVLQSLRDKGIITEHAISHAPEPEAISCPYYKQHGTKLINGRNFYRISTIQKIVPSDAPALDKEILSYFETVERDFYILSDRYSYFPKSFRVRKRLFREAIRYWLDFYSKNKIDGVFAICSPHNFPDYLAFHVAKFLGIKILMTTDVMINDHVLLLEDYRQVIKVPDNYLSEKSDAEIMASINPVLARKAFSESNEIKAAKKLNDNTLKISVNITAGKKDLSQDLKKFGKRARKFIKTGAFRPKFKATFAMNGEFSDSTRRLFRIQSGWRLKRLKNAYENLAIYPDFTKKYAYFAMHLNPERTTQPEAEVFEDHLLAIEILARSVPEDWIVYVKENPSQYGRKLNLVNGRHFRDLSDYLDYTRLQNVRLIRQDVKTADLIGNATITASLKGSVGWETMESGKGTIIFANAWYSAHRSAYRVDNIESCKQAIENILKKPANEVYTNKLKFLSYMQSNIITGSMGGHFNLEVMTEPYENLVESLTTNLAKRFRS